MFAPCTWCEHGASIASICAHCVNLCPLPGLKIFEPGSGVALGSVILTITRPFAMPTRKCVLAISQSQDLQPHLTKDLLSAVDRFCDFGPLFPLSVHIFSHFGDFWISVKPNHNHKTCFGGLMAGESPGITITTHGIVFFGG